MNLDHKALADRITALETRVADLASYLQSALDYLSSDPQSSLTKSRVILEKLLLQLYRGTMTREPARPMIGDMLSDRAFTAALPRRIVARMNAIRDMSNLGPHGEEVDATDAMRVMRDLIDVLEWYVSHYDPSCRVPGSHEARQALEILTQLKEKYPRYMRPEIISVRFVQSLNRCYLEITALERVNDYLVDETTRRSDLAFVSSDTASDELLFSPRRPISENVQRLLTNFDEISIINCTDLFTQEAATEIDDHCRQHGSMPNSS